MEAKDYGVIIKRRDSKDFRRVSWNGKKNFYKIDAYRLRNKIRKSGRKAKVIHDPQERNWKVGVKKRDGSGWRRITYKGAGLFAKSVAFKIKRILEERGREVKIREVVSQQDIDDRRISKWLSGDLDFDRELQIALSKVAKDIGWKLHVNYGKRTYAEQKALYDKYGPGRAARPGTSRHETGEAADVVSKRFRWMNLGYIPGARRAMRKHGVGLPVRGEAWHAEMTPVFNA